MPEMIKGNWWFKFEHTAWLTDEALSQCSLETQGFWIRCICVMQKSGLPEIAGTVNQVARLIGVFPEELLRCAIDLKNTKAADVTLGNGSVTLMSRRLKRLISDREQTRLRVRKHRGNADVTRQSKSNKKEVISKKKEEVVAAVAANGSDPVETRIWTDGVDLLSRSGLKQSDARAFLGKQAKDFGRESLAEAIAVTQAKNPADPKPFLVAVLQNRLGASEKAKAHVGKSEEVEIEVQCKTCFDTGQIRQTPANPRWEWDVEYVPCPSDHHKER